MGNWRKLFYNYLRLSAIDRATKMVLSRSVNSVFQIVHRVFTHATHMMLVEPIKIAYFRSRKRRREGAKQQIVTWFTLDRGRRSV